MERRRFEGRYLTGQTDSHFIIISGGEDTRLHSHSTRVARENSSQLRSRCMSDLACIRAGSGNISGNICTKMSRGPKHGCVCYVSTGWCLCILCRVVYSTQTKSSTISDASYTLLWYLKSKTCRQTRLLQIP